MKYFIIFLLLVPYATFAQGNFNAPDTNLQKIITQYKFQHKLNKFNSFHLFFNDTTIYLTSEPFQSISYLENEFAPQWMGMCDSTIIFYHIPKYGVNRLTIKEITYTMGLFSDLFGIQFLKLFSPSLWYSETPIWKINKVGQIYNIESKSVHFKILRNMNKN